MSERGPGGAFSNGFFGCFGVLAAVLVVLVGFLSLGMCSPKPAPAPSLPPVLTGDALIRSQIGTQPPPEGFAANAVLAARRESAGSERQTARDVKAFYFAGQPMACGYLDSGSGRERFIFRNENAVVEGRHQREVFDEFWQICRAAGVSGS